MKFSIQHFFTKCDQMFPAGLVTFTEETLNGKLHFLCCINGNSLSSKTEEIRFIVKKSKATVIGIPQTKLDGKCFEAEMYVEG